MCEHLHLPLQSGSDRGLAACTAATPPSATFASGGPRPAASPDLAVTTDLIVGFPGETDDDFERTLEVADAGYDSAYTFIYSPRPGTEAAAGTHLFVACRGRGEPLLERLRVVVERSALARHRARVGRVEEVLVEGPRASGTRT